MRTVNANAKEQQGEQARKAEKDSNNKDNKKESG
jgi:hypothetical protein